MSSSLRAFLRTFLRAFGWMLLLTLVVPGIAREWPWLWMLPYASPTDFLTTTPGILYATLCLLAILLFLAKASQRRLVLGLLLLQMVLLQQFTGDLGWERLAAYLACLGVGVFLVEAWRQNRPLIQQLRADEINTLRLLWQSLYLWSPLLLIICLGFYGNYLFLQATERLVYEVTPVDRYCDVPTPDHTHRIPCSGLAAPLAAQDLLERPLVETLANHIQERFTDALQLALQTVETLLAEDSPVDEEKWISLSQALTPEEILGLSAQEDPTYRALQQDETLRRLQRQLRQVNQQINTLERMLRQVSTNSWIKSILIKALQNQPDYQRAIKSRQSLSKRISARTKEVKRAALAEELAQEGGPAIPLRRRLVSSFRGLQINPKDLIVRTAEGQAELSLYLIRSLDQLELRTLSQTKKLLGSDPTVAYAVLYTTPRCSTERENPSVLDADGKPIVENLAVFPCFPLPETEQDNLIPLSLIQSTHSSIDAWQQERERALTTKFRTIAKASYESAADVQGKAAELTDTVPDTIHLGRKTCDLLHPGNCLTNFVKGEAEDAYETRKASFDQGAAELVRRESQATANSVAEALMLARAEAYATLDASTTYLRRSVDGLQQLGRLLAVLLNVLLVLAVIKSFLYVLATRIFDARSEFHINLGEGVPAQGTYDSAPAIEIPRSFTRPLITRDVLDNQSVSTAIAPWPLSAPLARIATGTYFGFNRGSHFELSEEAMAFSRANGHDVIDWQLEEGEEVVFHYRNFFGASDNVQLKTTISLRLSTLLLGRIIFHNALCTDGPGRLLLTSAGTVRDQSKTDSTSLPRLLAWNKHTRFRVASQGTIRSVLLDGYAIVRLRDEPQRAGLIVVEAIRENRSKVVGSLRFVRNLLLPF